MYYKMYLFCLTYTNIPTTQKPPVGYVKNINVLELRLSNGGKAGQDLRSFYGGYHHPRLTDVCGERSLARLSLRGIKAQIAIKV